jgi:hypothetical protein
MSESESKRERESESERASKGAETPWGYFF